MSIKSCFWALLSVKDFEFIYIPQFTINETKSFRDCLLSQSLLMFVHPEERSLAKMDLSKFIESKTISGAVTRCRLLNLMEYLTQEQDEIAEIIKKHSFPIQLDDLYRIFQIYTNSNDNSISWPSDFEYLLNQENQESHPLYPLEIQEIFVKSSSNLAKSQVALTKQTCSLGCFQYMYSKTNVQLEGLCEMEKMVIHYGPLVFAFFKIIPIQ
ncbi:hypothetical protein CU098_003048, partial [Rhizopus stolonifer]